MSPNRKATAILIGGIALANLLLVNDYLTVLPGAETHLLETAMGKWQIVNLPEAAAQWLGMSTALGASFFKQRLVSVLVWVAGLFAFFLLSKRLFSELTALLSTLALTGSILLTLLAKLAVADAWLSILLALNYLCLIAAIKQSYGYWKLAYWATAVLSLMVALLPAFLFCLSAASYLFFLHPQGNRLRQLYIWIGWPALALITLVSGETLAFPNSLWFGLSYFSALQLAGLVLLGLLPWLGFLPAACWDLYKRLREREEMALILAGFLLSSILSFSALIFVPLLVLCSRHAVLHFRKNYPYDKINKSVFILMEIALFLVVMLFILQSLHWFGTVGMRAAMFVSMILWGLLFGVIIGLFAKRRFLAWGSLLLAGPLCTLVFLIQYVPQIEMHRQAPKVMLTQVKSNQATFKEIYVDTLLPEKAMRQLAFYADVMQVNIEKKIEEDGTKRGATIVTSPLVSPADTTNITLPWWWLGVPSDTVFLLTAPE